jgi:hypothetical protein
LSISLPQQSTAQPGRRLNVVPAAPLTWNERVALEQDHQARIEAAFDRADAYAAFGDFERALKWLARADALTGGLSPAYRAERAHWARELSRREVRA